MSASENRAASAAARDTSSDESLRLAVAISLLRSKFLQNHPPPSQSDALKWKRKAKERKQEILRLRDDLKEAEDASQFDLFPQTASCKCYFFGNLGKLSPNRLGDASDRRFNDVLRRRFLRQVRLRERRKGAASSLKGRVLGCNDEDQAEQLKASIDFLVELCDTSSPVQESKFENWSHQAVEFILVALKNLLSTGRKLESIEGVVSSLIMRLVRLMSSPSRGDEAHHSDTNSQFYIQHLLRKLGCEPYIGQRVILSVSQRISVLAESLLFSDPFDENFPAMHECMFVMIQLIEFLVSDYLLTWPANEGFDNILFEEWVTSLVQARKAVEVLESRNGLYVVYMDRVTGELAKLVGQVPLSQKLNSDIFDALFR
ncbi:protein MULTIPOLAR SPINDLE 1 isoform X1 [Herrania umbratica]|uniref:Protein MULTIPOLAR SPINDLE 1 isoform X1 n=1 Tax=Herrania umbratica TaxID=108875 RepID=A0A6J0ZSA5_9ROSI|nr:protein MULTIPOLAR SPINDLE 1 isoform X1 [Herrania umbratica]